MYLPHALFGALLGALGVVCAPVELQDDSLPLEIHTQTPLDSISSDPELLPSPPSEGPFLIPSRYESTILGRRLLALSKTGVLTTVFPENITSPRVPNDVARTPIGLPDYIASCEEPSGNPTLLALTISTSTKNAFAGSNVSLALSWWDEYVHLTHKQPWSAANLPRLSMVGYLEVMTDEEVKTQNIAGCFTAVHGDSALWLPGKKWAAHKGLWTRLVVKEVYWIGGFGDRNFIGWFDADEWRGVAREEWEAVRLPGEKWSS